MKVLLTGGTGLLGRYILQTLRKSGHQVRLFVRNPAKVTQIGLEADEVMEGDVLDMTSLEQAMEGMDAVIHSAALVSFWNKRHDQMLKVNVEGTANVVDLCLELGINKLVHISSVAALGPQVNGLIHEGTKWKATSSGSFYGRTKYLAELEVFRGIQEGLNASILNPAVIIGEGDWVSGSSQLFKAVHDGLKYYTPSSTGWVYAGDVAEAVLSCLERDPPTGEKFILSAENLSYQQALQSIGKALGQKGPTKKAPIGLLKITGRLVEWMKSSKGKDPLITAEIAKMADDNAAYDGSKAVRELGISYTPIQNAIQEVAGIYLKSISH